MKILGSLLLLFRSPDLSPSLSSGGGDESARERERRRLGRDLGEREADAHAPAPRRRRRRDPRSRNGPGDSSRRHHAREREGHSGRGERGRKGADPYGGRDERHTEARDPDRAQRGEERAAHSSAGRAEPAWPREGAKKVLENDQVVVWDYRFRRTGRSRSTSTTRTRWWSSSSRASRAGFRRTALPQETHLAGDARPLRAARPSPPRGIRERLTARDRRRDQIELASVPLAPRRLRSFPAVQPALEGELAPTSPSRAAATSGSGPPSS